MDGVVDGRRLPHGWVTETSYPALEIHFRISSLLYSALPTIPFRVNSANTKLWVLLPTASQYVQAIYDHLIDVKDDGTFRLKMDYFTIRRLTMKAVSLTIYLAAPEKTGKLIGPNAIWIMAAPSKRFTKEIHAPLGEASIAKPAAEKSFYGWGRCA